MFDDKIKTSDNASCNGFHHCSNRKFDHEKEDCQECKQDVINAFKQDMKRGEL